MDSSGKPLADAEVDVWHTDANGIYGGIGVGSDAGFCRGVVRSDAQGRYSFRTQETSSYGSLRVWFGSPYVPELPPYGPRHIHVLVWHKQLGTHIYQLYFESDPARFFDWRAYLLEDEDMLRSKDPRCLLKRADDTTYEFDFVLDKAKDAGTAANRTQAALLQCGHANPSPPALCHPRIAQVLRPEVFLAVVLMWLFLAYKIARWCCCGRGAKKTTSSTKQKKH